MADVFCFLGKSTAQSAVELLMRRFSYLPTFLHIKLFFVTLKIIAVLYYHYSITICMTVVFHNMCTDLAFKHWVWNINYIVVQLNIWKCILLEKRKTCIIRSLSSARLNLIIKKTVCPKWFSLCVNLIVNCRLTSVPDQSTVPAFLLYKVVDNTH